MPLRNRGRQAAALATAIVLSLGGLLATAGAANASPTCGPYMVWRGNAGEVNAQLGPTGFIQWGEKDYVDNGGLVAGIRDCWQQTGR